GQLAHAGTRAPVRSVVLLGCWRLGSGPDYAREVFDALDRPVLPPGERDGEDVRVLLARYQRLVDRALERMESRSEAEWRRAGTQLPDPQVNRIVPQPTDMAEPALPIVEHSGTHLRRLRDNLAAYPAQIRRAEGSQADQHGAWLKGRRPFQRH